MKKILALTLALCMVLALCACGGTSASTASSAPSAAASGSVIKIGHIGPMTGALAMYGTTTTNAAKLAVQQINSAGGVKVGDKAYTLELEAKDDQGDRSARDRGGNLQGRDFALAGEHRTIRPEAGSDRPSRRRSRPSPCASRRYRTSRAGAGSLPGSF